MQADTFKKIHAAIESSGINYYAYVTDNGAAKLAVSDKDLEWLKEIIGASSANMTVEKSTVSHVPPERSIIGNTSYRAIPNKQYLSMDSDLALKTAEYLNKANIPFSGVVYRSGKATLTVSNADLERAKAKQQEIIALRSEHRRNTRERSSIIGTIPYRDIKNRHFFFSRIKPDEYMQIKPFLDKLDVAYSGLIREDMLFQTGSGLFDLLNKGLNGEQPYSALTAEAQRMEMSSYAAAEQSGNNNFSVVFNYDEQSVQIYLTNGIAEADRTADNTLITTKDMSELRKILAEINEHSYNGINKDNMLIDRLIGVNDIDLIREVSFRAEIFQLGNGEIQIPNAEQMAYINSNRDSLYMEMPIVSATTNAHMLYKSAYDVAEGMFLLGGSRHEKEHYTPDNYFSDYYLNISSAEHFIESVYALLLTDTHEVVPFEEAVKRMNATGETDLNHLAVVADLVEKNGRHFRTTMSIEDFYVLAKRTMDNPNELKHAVSNIPKYDKALEEIREKSVSYIHDKDNMPSVVRKMVAGDELGDIERRIFGENPENAADVAKEYITGSIMTFLLPESMLSDNARHIYELCHFHIEAQDDRAIFHLDDIGESVSYSWDEVGEFLRAAAIEDIAKLIYPEADIRISGFQDVAYQNGCFDVAVGNVPFGDLGFNDREYSTSKLHDYFFAKSLDKVKEGGIVAFVTSKGTLDKKDESVRRYLAERADLIGAIRLPSTAFKGNANTEVTTDIIFLQKRSSPPEHEPDWVHLGHTADGFSVNSYYEQHPEMVLGKIVQGNKLYANTADDTMCIPIEGADLRQQLSEAISTLSAQISDVRTAEVYSAEYKSRITPPPELKNYSFFEHEGNIYFKQSDRVAEEYRLNDKHKDRKPLHKE